MDRNVYTNPSDHIIHKGAALEFTEKLLGGPIMEVESTKNIGAAAVQIAPGNGDRVGLLIVNFGSDDLYLNPGPTSTLFGGTRIVANGGSLSMDVTQDFTLPARAWFAVAINTTSAVYVLELIRFTDTPG